jgi:nitrate/nitrite transporter NarK
MGMGPDGDPPRPAAEPPGPQTNEPKSGTPRYEGDFTPREALRTEPFWHLTSAIGMRQFSKQLLSVHLIPLLVWKGIDEPAAALLLSVFALLQIPLRIAAAHLADRWSMTKVSALSAMAGVGAVGALLLPAYGWVGTGLLFVLFFALGETGNSPGWAVIGEYFGRSNYATIRGAISMAQSAISLPAPVLAGWFYDTTQSYELALLFVGVSYLLSFALYWTLHAPRQPVRELSAAP